MGFFVCVIARPQELIARIVHIRGGEISKCHLLCPSFAHERPLLIYIIQNITSYTMQHTWKRFHYYVHVYMHFKYSMFAMMLRVYAVPVVNTTKRNDTLNSAEQLVLLIGRSTFQFSYRS